MKYAELQVTTHYSFLRGASSPGELFEQAKLWELVRSASSIAIHWRVSSKPMRRRRTPEFVLWSDAGLISRIARRFSSHPMDRPAYSRLCRLLSLGRGEPAKGKCTLDWNDAAMERRPYRGVLVMMLTIHFRPTFV